MSFFPYFLLYYNKIILKQEPIIDIYFFTTNTKILYILLSSLFKEISTSFSSSIV